MKPTIYGFAQSSYCWTVRAAAAIKGVDVDFVNITPGAHKQAEYLARHPWGKVPALEHGEVRLWESEAICQYIDEAFGGRQLMPTDPYQRALVTQWVSSVNDYLYKPAVLQYIFAYIFPGTEDGSPDAARIEAAQPALKHWMGILDENLVDGNFLVGGQLTVADLFLAPLIFGIARFPEGGELVTSHTNVLAYQQRMLSEPGFMAGAPQQ